MLRCEKWPGSLSGLIFTQPGSPAPVPRDIHLTAGLVPTRRCRRRGPQGGQFPTIQPHRRRGDLHNAHVIDPQPLINCFQIYRMLHNIRFDIAAGYRVIHLNTVAEILIFDFIPFTQ